MPHYVIADVDEAAGRRRLTLKAYRLKGRKRAYEPVQVNERGWAWLEPLGLWLGVKVNADTGGDRLALFDPETGLEIADYTAVRRMRGGRRAAEAAQTPKPRPAPTPRPACARPKPNCAGSGSEDPSSSAYCQTPNFSPCRRAGDHGARCEQTSIRIRESGCLRFPAPRVRDSQLIMIGCSPPRGREGREEKRRKEKKRQPRPQAVVPTEEAPGKHPAVRSGFVAGRFVAAIDLVSGRASLARVIKEPAGSAFLSVRSEKTKRP